MRASGGFNLNHGAHLYQRGLQFAHLGRRAGGVVAFDSGPHRSRGTMTGIAATDWYFDHELQRFAIDYASGDNYLDFGFSPVLGTGAWSVAGLVKVNSSGFFDGPICGWGDTATANNYVNLNIDSSAYFHVDQGPISNSNSYTGAFATDTWQQFLYVHPPDSNIKDGRLWVGGDEKSGGGTGTTTLDLKSTDALRLGSDSNSGTFNIVGQMSDLLVFDQQLGAFEAAMLANLADLSLGGLIVDGLTANAYDLEGIR